MSGTGRLGGVNSRQRLEWRYAGPLFQLQSGSAGSDGGLYGLHRQYDGPRAFWPYHVPIGGDSHPRSRMASGSRARGHRGGEEKVDRVAASRLRSAFPVLPCQREKQTHNGPPCRRGNERGRICSLSRTFPSQHIRAAGELSLRGRPSREIERIKLRKKRINRPRSRRRPVWMAAHGRVRLPSANSCRRTAKTSDEKASFFT